MSSGVVGGCGRRVRGGVAAALRAGAPTQPKRTNAVILSWPTVESSDAAAFDSSGFRISLQIRFNSREYN